jgi:beta-glucosidase
MISVSRLRFRPATRLVLLGAAVIVTFLSYGALGSGRAVARGSDARAAADSASCPWVSSSAPIAERVSQVLAHMTLDDEITMVEGAGSSNPYVFYMPGIPSLCIPPLGEEDGPNGVADKLTGVTQLPAGVALAATFDPAIARTYGEVIGQEEWGKGAAVNLGPTVNIDRDPRWGRSFESFTEDPFLNASLAVSEIDGVQSTGEMSQVKHFDVYNQETNRNLPPDDAIVSQRALHEIYMPAFQSSVEQANVASVMCSYSSVNGDPACDDPFLETTTLRDEWDFPGFVTSDYGALRSTSGALDGTDQEQPENTYFGTALAQAVTSGTIPHSVLTTMVARMLSEMFRFNLFAAPPTGTTTATVTSPAHQTVSNEVADASAVLLRNSGGTLPLHAHTGTIAVIGPAASAQPVYGGGGSATVIPSSIETPLEGIQAGAATGTTVTYTQGLPTDTSLSPIPASDLSPAYAPTSTGATYSGTLTAPETGTYVFAIDASCQCYAPTYLSVAGRTLIADPGTPPVSTYSASIDLVAGQKYPVTITYGNGSGGNPGGQTSSLTWATPSQLAPGIAQAAAAAKSASRAVVVVSDDTESEGADRPSLALPSAQDDLVSAVTAANPHTAVVIDAGAPVAMPWLSRAGAVLDAWYPGQTNGASLAQLIYGSADPSGHLPVTFPQSLAQVPAASPARFPGVGNSVQYSEGLEVGYRWYDEHNLTPLFPFGFGLSYTAFRISNGHVSTPRADGTGDETVSATVRNTGHVAGADVVQLYLADPASAGEPGRELVGFQRVQLRPGGSSRVHFTITPKDTWWWNDAAHGWDQTDGTYHVYVGDSSALANLPVRLAFRLPQTIGTREVTVSAPNTLAPGRAARVSVRLSGGGTARLARVRLALRLPTGFTVTPLGHTTFRNVTPQAAVVARFRIIAPSYAPNASVTVHATATFARDAAREAGVTTTVT